MAGFAEIIRIQFDALLQTLCGRSILGTPETGLGCWARPSSSSFLVNLQLLLIYSFEHSCGMTSLLQSVTYVRKRGNTCMFLGFRNEYIELYAIRICEPTILFAWDGCRLFCDIVLVLCSLVLTGPGCGLVFFWWFPLGFELISYDLWCLNATNDPNFSVLIITENEKPRHRSCSTIC